MKRKRTALGGANYRRGIESALMRLQSGPVRHLAGEELERFAAERGAQVAPPRAPRALAPSEPTDLVRGPRPGRPGFWIRLCRGRVVDRSDWLVR